MNSKNLPLEWVDKIFMRLHGRFGNQFLDKFRIGQLNHNGEDVGIVNAKQVWAEDCRHLTAERVRKGLEAKYDFPPSCDDFILQSRPTPASHLDNKLLSLPRPKASKDVADKKMKDIRTILNMEVSS